MQQGAGRHDNPELYGCLYASEESVSAVAEQLAPFRGTGSLLPSCSTGVAGGFETLCL
jgi:hypothetical protein